MDYNIILILTDSLRWDYFIESNIPQILHPCNIFKGRSTGITHESLPKIISGNSSSIATPAPLPRRILPEKTDLFHILRKYGYLTTYINVDFKSDIMNDNLIPLFDFPCDCNTLNNLFLYKERQFLALIHIWDTHFPWTVTHKFPWAESGRLDNPRIKKYFDSLSPEELQSEYMDGINSLELNKLPILLKELEQRKLDKETIIVLVSDHGERLKENGRMFHSSDLTDPRIRDIPIVFKIPKRNKTIWHKETIDQIDIVPSLLYLLKRNIPESVDGKNRIKRLD